MVRWGRPTLLWDHWLTARAQVLPNSSIFLNAWVLGPNFLRKMFKNIFQRILMLRIFLGFLKEKSARKDFSMQEWFGKFTHAVGEIQIRET